MAETSDYDQPIPPAEFTFLIESLLMQAQVQLGLLHFGSEQERPKPNLAWAKHSIDLLGVLQEKTKGNLTLTEQRLLENGLTELRFRYVQIADEQKRAESRIYTPPPAAEEEPSGKGPIIVTADGGKGTKTD